MDIERSSSKLKVFLATQSQLIKNLCRSTGIKLATAADTIGIKVCTRPQRHLECQRDFFG